MAGSGNISFTSGQNSPQFVPYRILIDLGGDLSSDPSKTPITDPDGNGNYWNKFVGTGTYSGSGGVVNGFYNGLSLSNMVDTSNNNKGMRMVLIQTPNTGFLTAGKTPGLNADGTTSDVSDYVAQATRDSMFSYSTTIGQLLFLGLDKSRTYSFKFWGSRMTGGAIDNRYIEIKKLEDSWTGAPNFNASNNTDYNNAVTISSITNVQSIGFNMRSLSGSTFGYIGIIDINVT